jgi:hypothetical protein
MELQLKSLSPSAIPEALQKVERYRLLNEPWQAESICLDILRVQPANQEALIMLLLSITDDFDTHIDAPRAREVLSAIEGEYERAYYGGIIYERSARARLKQGNPGSNYKAYEEIASAMRCYEQAEGLRPPGNDDAILRWNTCARTLVRNPELRPQPKVRMETVLDD